MDVFVPPDSTLIRTSYKKRRSLSGALLASTPGRWIFGAFLQVLGRMAVERIEPSDDDKFLLVKFRGLDRTLYWPESLGLETLFIIAQEQLYSWNWHNYEIPETRVLEDDVVLDCGAAEGLFSLRVAGRCASTVAIEPLPLFHESLKRTFSEIGNVRTAPVALSDRIGRGYLVEDGIETTIADEGPGTAVEIVTVDELCSRMDIVPTYIKADLEGSEPSMIRGARELISRHKPRLAVTTYHYLECACEVESLLRRLNPDYTIRTKGVIPTTGAPFMLHAW